jgi:hypothetical protein
LKEQILGLVLVFWRLCVLCDAALGPEGSALKGYQFEKSSEYGEVFGLYSRAKGKSPTLLVTNRLNQRFQSRSPSRITFDCFPRYPESVKTIL